MVQSCSSSGFATQAEKIENLLRSRYGQWIPAYELADVALQYCARINSLRKKLLRSGDRERVQNRTVRVGGRVHGSYRIVRMLDAVGVAPSKPTSRKSWEQVCAERDAKLAEQDKWELVP